MRRVHLVDPLMPVVLVGASITSEIVVQFTDSRMGVCALFLVVIMWMAEIKGMQAGFLAAFYSMLFINWYIIPPHNQFSLPSLNELFVYACGFVSAYLGGRFFQEPGSADSLEPVALLEGPRTPVAVTGLMNLLDHIAMLNDDRFAREGEIEEAEIAVSETCKMLIEDARSARSLEDLRPLVMALDLLERAGYQGLCGDEDVVRIAKALICGVRQRVSITPSPPPPNKDQAFGLIGEMSHCWRARNKISAATSIGTAV